MEITQRCKNDFVRIGVIGDLSGKIVGIDFESWDFFKYISLMIIKSLNVRITEKNDGPDSSRWVGIVEDSQIHFEFDDMIGTTICVRTGGVSSMLTIHNIVCLLRDDECLKGYDLLPKP